MCKCCQISHFLYRKNKSCPAREQSCLNLDIADSSDITHQTAGVHTPSNRVECTVKRDINQPTVIPLIHKKEKRAKGEHSMYKILQNITFLVANSIIFQMSTVLNDTHISFKKKAVRRTGIKRTTNIDEN